MRGYFFGVIVVAIVGSVVMATSSHTGSARHIKFLCSLCVIGCLAFPLLSLLEGEFDTDGVLELFESDINEEKYDEIYNDYFLKSEIENASKTLKIKINKELEIDDDCYDLNIVLDKNSDEKNISRVEIIIYASGLTVDPRGIKALIGEYLGCECEIFYDMKK